MEIVKKSLRVDVLSALGRREVDFSLQCEVVVLPRSGATPDEGVEVLFEVAHVYPEEPNPVEPGELRLTKVSFRAADLDRFVTTPSLRSVTADGLIQLAKGWIVDDGKPNGPINATWVSRGEVNPVWEPWENNRARFITHLKPARKGTGGGRPITRDDEYLRQLAEDALRAHEREPGAYLDELWKMRRDGPDAKSKEGFRSDMTILRAEGWIEPTSRGSRAGPRPGPRLLEVRERERASQKRRRRTT